MERRVRLGLAAIASAALLSSPLAASGDPIDPAWKLLDNGQDLSGLELLHAIGFHEDGSIANDMAAQMWSQFAPRLDGLIHVLLPDPKAAGKQASAQDIAAVKASERRDAIDTIVAMARDRKVVILNEEHYAPEDRAFGLAVAKALRPLGFTMLAAETFNNAKDPAHTDMAALAARGYPTRKTGVYTADPVFADFVRQALTLGYAPVAYEQTGEQYPPPGADRIDAREEAEASNLAAAMARAPQAKFLVYVGYSHAAENPLREEEGEQSHLWMAGRLKQKTGIDPLTIDQTDLGAANVSPSSRTLRAIVQQQGINRSVILFTEGKPLRVGRYRDAIDLQVIHPATRVVHDRPNWLETMGRHPVRPAPDLVPKSGRALVQAFLTREGSDAVPLDQIVLEPGGRRWFMLPDERVRFIVKERLPAR